ncbi:MAG: hypothetical protein ACOX8U_03700, partial [Bradymonadia bacterium]
KYMAGSNKDLYEHLDANAAYSLFSVDQVIALIKRRCATYDCYAIAARKLFPYVVDRKNWPKIYNMIPQNDLPALQNYCKQEMQRKPSPCYRDCVAMSDEEFKDFGPKYMAGSNKDLYEHLDANAAYSLFSVDQVIALIKRRCATNDCYAIAARKLFPYVVDRKNWPKVYNMIPQNDLPALQNYCKQEMQRKPSPCHRD